MSLFASPMFLSSSPPRPRRYRGEDYAPVPPRYRTPYFSHIMGGYAAGYYAYIWSEVLDANTVQYIKQHGGLTRENGDRMRQYVLAPGGQIAAGKLFPNFSGYEAKIGPLLVKRGLAEAPKSDDAAPTPEAGAPDSAKK